MSTTASADKRKTGGARSGRRQRLRLDKTPYSYQFGALTVLLLLAAGAQWVVKGPLASTGYGSVIIAVAGVVLAGLFTWVAGRALYHYLASAKSAVVVLTAAMVLTGVGTVVLQGISEADFTSRYGSFAGPLLWLGLNDVFHSYPFTLLLIMLGATSTITVIRRRKTLLRWRHFGLLLTHISVVALLIGAAIGTMTGSKGMIHLETGRSGNSYVPDVRPGEAKRPPVQLGFDVRLDHFELDNYTAEYKVYTYESDGAGDYDMVASEEPEVGKTAGVPAPDADIQVTVKKVFKRARQVSAWVPASTPAERASKPGPAAKIEMFRGDTVVASGWLQDTEKVLRDPGQRFEMHLAWTAPDDAALSKLALPSAQSEFEIAQPDGSKVAVEPGKTFELADGRVVQVRKFLPDFVYDNTSGQAVSRSNEPRNPALVVDVSNPAAGGAPKTFYLFAMAEMRKMMQRSDHGRTDLLFHHHPGARSVSRSIVVVGATSERIVVEAGKVLERKPMAWGKRFAPLADNKDLSLVVDKPIPSAVHRATWQDVAKGPENPAVELEVVRSGERGTFVLPARGSKPIPIGGKRILVYREKPNKVRNYKSTVTVLKQGKPVLTTLMQVNHPLSYGGFEFYQSNYDPKNPRYSGLQVVRDPGLFLVNIAFWVLMYGVLHTVMLRRWTPPWERNRRRRKRKDQPGKPTDAGDGTEVAA